MKSVELNHLLVNTKTLMKEFMGLTFSHVFIELNAEAGSLLKIALGEMDGRLHYSLFSKDCVVRSGQLVPF